MGCRHFSCIRAAERIRGRSGDREWGLRNKLKANVEHRDRDKTHAMVGTLAELDDIGPARRGGQEELRHLLPLARTDADRRRISQRLFRFYIVWVDSDVAELEQLARTVQNWWTQIEAFIHNCITDTTSEGINRVVQFEARNAYSFRIHDY